MFFELMSKWFWLICLVVAFQYLRPSPSLKGRLEIDPGFSEEHRRLRRGFFALLALPWLYVGFAQLFGGVPNVWHFIHPQNWDAFQIGFVVVVGLVWAYFLVFVFFREGAKKIADHQLIVVYFAGRRKELDETKVKVFAVVVVAIGVMALWHWMSRAPAIPA